MPRRDSPTDEVLLTIDPALLSLPTSQPALDDSVNPVPHTVGGVGIPSSPSTIDNVDSIEPMIAALLSPPFEHAEYSNPFPLPPARARHDGLADEQHL